MDVVVPAACAERVAALEDQVHKLQQALGSWNEVRFQEFVGILQSKADKNAVPTTNEFEGLTRSVESKANASNVPTNEQVGSLLKQCAAESAAKMVELRGEISKTCIEQLALVEAVRLKADAATVEALGGAVDLVRLKGEEDSCRVSQEVAVLAGRVELKADISDVPTNERFRSLAAAVESKAQASEARLLELADLLQHKADRRDAPTREDFDGLAKSVALKADADVVPTRDHMESCLARHGAELRAALGELQGHLLLAGEQLGQLEGDVQLKADKLAVPSKDEFDALEKAVRLRAVASEVPTRGQVNELADSLQCKADVSLVTTAVAGLERSVGSLREAAEESAASAERNIAALAAEVRLKADQATVPTEEQFRSLAVAVASKADAGEVPGHAELRSLADALGARADESAAAYQRLGAASKSMQEEADRQMARSFEQFRMLQESIHQKADVGLVCTKAEAHAHVEALAFKLAGCEHSVATLAETLQIKADKHCAATKEELEKVGQEMQQRQDQSRSQLLECREELEKVSQEMQQRQDQSRSQLLECREELETLSQEMRQRHDQSRGQFQEMQQRQNQSHSQLQEMQQRQDQSRSQLLECREELEKVSQEMQQKQDQSRSQLLECREELERMSQEMQQKQDQSRGQLLECREELERVSQEMQQKQDQSRGQLLECREELERVSQEMQQKQDQSRGQLLECREELEKVSQEMQQKQDQSRGQLLERKVDDCAQRVSLLGEAVEAKADASRVALRDDVQALAQAVQLKDDRANTALLERDVSACAQRLSGLEEAARASAEQLQATVEDRFQAISRALQLKGGQAHAEALERKVDAVSCALQLKGDHAHAEALDRKLDACVQSVSALDAALNTKAGKDDVATVEDLQAVSREMDSKLDHARTEALERKLDTCTIRIAALREAMQTQADKIVVATKEQFKGDHAHAEALERRVNTSIQQMSELREKVLQAEAASKAAESRISSGLADVLAGKVDVCTQHVSMLDEALRAKADRIEVATKDELQLLSRTLETKISHDKEFKVDAAITAVRAEVESVSNALAYKVAEEKRHVSALAKALHTKADKHAVPTVEDHEALKDSLDTVIRFVRSEAGACSKEAGGELKVSIVKPEPVSSTPGRRPAAKVPTMPASGNPEGLLRRKRARTLVPMFEGLGPDSPWQLEEVSASQDAHSRG